MASKPWTRHLGGIQSSSHLSPVLLLAVVACWTGAVGVPPPAAPAVVQPAIVGSYRCAIETEDGFRYPPFRCQIRVANQGGLTLTKLAGSQRFSGTLTARGDGYHFEGHTFCPFGDCTEPLEGDFYPVAGELRAEFRDAGLIVHMTRGLGGESYGGDGYGTTFDFTNVDINGAGSPVRPVKRDAHGRVDPP